jgi:hypothetical protein
MPSSWKLAATAIALIGGATFSLAGLLTSAPATQSYAPMTSASTSDRRFVATRPESARRRHRSASSRRPYRREAGAAPGYYYGGYGGYPYGYPYNYGNYGYSAGYYGGPGYFPYARRWHLGKPSEIGFGPRPTGQYSSFEELDSFP